MAEYGHGNHWDCFTNTEDLVERHLPCILTDGVPEDTAAVEGSFFEDEVRCETTVFSYVLRDTPLSAMALVGENVLSETNELLSAYPYVKSGTDLRLRIEEIHEWPNGYEAAITGETDCGLAISFFDTKYFKHKSSYRVGDQYQFSIAASAYSAEGLQERTFQFEGQQAVDFLKKTGRSPERDEDGSIRPVVFDLSGLVAYLPGGGSFPDDAEFQSPVISISEVQGFGAPFYCLKIYLHREPEIVIDLYAKQDMFSAVPQETDPVRGMLWMQGSLAE